MAKHTLLGSSDEYQERIDLVLLQYIDEEERGLAPRLADYLRLYPELRAGLLKGVTEYWQTGKGILEQAYARENDPEFQAQIAATLQDPQVRAKAREIAAKVMENLSHNP